MITHSYRTWLMALTGLWLFGCAAAGGGHREAQRLVARGQYDRAEKNLVTATMQNPKDAVAFRLLGIAQYKLENYPSAGKALSRALELDPRDAVAHFYAGLLADRNNQTDEAIHQYESFRSLTTRGALAQQAERRILDLQARRAEEFAKQAIANEKGISPGRFSDSTIGVVYFESRFLSDQLRPLATGLAELLSNDLSRVHALRVVERIRVNQLLDELKLAYAGAFDTATAPRLGKLLGAAHVLGGSLAELPGEKLRIDPNLVDTKSGEVVLPEGAVGVLEQVLHMEKQVTFSTLARLGIKLTDAERDSIAQLPTSNFRAFLMYSRGLELLDQGDAKGAATEFKRAVEYDPGFQQAKTEIQTTQVLIQTAPTGSVDDFEHRVEADPSLHGPTGGNTEQALVAGQDRLGFLPEAGRGHDEPYTSPYGRRAITGVVIIHGQFDNTQSGGGH